MNVWRVIHKLEGCEVECENISDRKIFWKVVIKRNKNQFHSIREKEIHYFVPSSLFESRIK